MMKKTYTYSLIAFALFLYGNSAKAETYKYPEFTIEIPDGWEDPVSANQQGGKTWGFTKKHPETGTAALVQVTIYDFGSLPQVSKAELIQAKDNYLMQMLSGVERRRTDFTTSNISDDFIGNEKARAIDWEGRVSNYRAKGRMYLTLINSLMFSVHIQDLEKFYYETMPILKTVVNSIQLTAANKALKEGTAQSAAP